MEKRDILQLIEQEIALIADSERSPGWTKWAIYSAIAGIIWLVLQELGKQQYRELEYSIHIELVRFYNIGFYCSKVYWIIV
jgi:hypothetical protein